MTAGELQMKGRGKLRNEGESVTTPGESGKWGKWNWKRGKVKRFPGEFETILGETEKDARGN